MFIDSNDTNNNNRNRDDLHSKLHFWHSDLSSMCLLVIRLIVPCLLPEEEQALNHRLYVTK